ncbi:hypothetical protein GQ600_20935 [Phytophthora cactorum]|nr:hypothetical protein GQ600_20935 [Phytophthora cactorum]
MVRNTGTSNYSLSDIARLLLLVEKTFPLGKASGSSHVVLQREPTPWGTRERDSKVCGASSRGRMDAKAHRHAGYAAAH